MNVFNLIDYELDSRWADAQTMGSQGARYVVFSSAAYADLEKIWFQYIFKQGVRRTDIDLFYLSESPMDQKIGAINIPWDGAKKSLWVIRCAVFCKLSNLGVSFFHFDLDAVAMAPVIQELSTEADLLFSQGTVWPSFALEALGFCVCAGWFLSRGTKASRLFWEEVFADVILSGDDQYSINKILVARKKDVLDASYSVSESVNQIEFRHLATRATILTEMREGTFLRAVVLPMTQVSRRINIKHGTYVWHPYIPGYEDRVRIFSTLN